MNTPEKTERDTVIATARHLSRRVYFGILAAALGALIVVNVVSALGAIPAACGICHGTAHAGWRNAPHEEVRCVACHEGAGGFGVVARRVKVMGMVASYVTGLYQRPVTAHVPNERCLPCHTDVAAQTVVANGLRVSHKEVIEAGYGCADCHGAVAHGSGALRQTFPELSTCLKCHNGTKARSECGVCHVDDSMIERTGGKRGSWQITHGKNWRQTHGAGDTATCKACHSKVFCSRCHTIALPHPIGWTTTHGGQVTGSPEVAASCKQCHKGALCESCHQVQMPHPESFLAEHSSLVEKDGDEKCYTCHLKEGCTNCHGYHTHPGVPKDKIRLLRKEAGLE